MFGFGRRRKKKFSEMTDFEKQEAFTSGYQSDDYLKLQEKLKEQRRQREEEERKRREEEEEERRRREAESDPLSAWSFVNQGKKKDRNKNDGGFGW